MIVPSVIMIPVMVQLILMSEVIGSVVVLHLVNFASLLAPGTERKASGSHNVSNHKRLAVVIPQ
jgi:hypothetical protein